MEHPQAKQILEGLLFASDEPLPTERLCHVLELPTDTIAALVVELRDEYVARQRALTILEVAGGYQMATVPDVAPWIRKCYRQSHQERLSKPALETLAIIAYKQPLTRAEMEAIRGVNVDGVVQTLLEKNLIRIMGRKETPGRPVLYGTTKEFLQYFGLNSLMDLPKLAEVTPEQQALAMATANPEGGLSDAVAAASAAAAAVAPVVGAEMSAAPATEPTAASDIPSDGQ